MQGSPRHLSYVRAESHLSHEDKTAKYPFFKKPFLKPILNLCLEIIFHIDEKHRFSFCFKLAL